MATKKNSDTRRREGGMEVTRDRRLKRNRDAIKELGREKRR